MSRNSNALLLCAHALVGAVVLLAGCAGEEVRPPASVSGTVFLDGQPLSSGSIHFTSPKSGETAYANLDQNGRYTVEFPEADIGAAYEVTVGPLVEEDIDATAVAENPPEKVENPVPAKYRERTTSGLTFTIQEAGENEFDVQLQSK